MAEDEQAWANGYLEKVTFANGNTDIMPSSPIEMDSVGTLKTTPSAQIGGDTDAILQQLGYDPETIHSMKQTGAIK